jgi:hypothetical protein
MAVVTLVIALIALVLSVLALVLFAWLYGRMYYWVEAPPAAPETGDEYGSAAKPEVVPEMLKDGSTQPPGKA